MEGVAAKADEKRFASKQVATGEIFYCTVLYIATYLGVEKKKKWVSK
jgi:hypothetical protein